MEFQIVRRRVGRILNHVAPCDDILPSNPHLFPMNCSSTLNTMVCRYDNRLLFARQGSASQPCFMQPVSSGQNTEHDHSFQLNSHLTNSSSGTCDSSNRHSEVPLFSRKALTIEQPVKQDFSSSSEHPKFARQISRNNDKKELSCNLARPKSVCHGLEWTPRIDVVESASNYVVIVELPGVNVSDILVEVDDQNLTVSGKRFNQQRRATDFSENLNPTFHRREIFHGPYRAVWSLPKDVNKENVSAEFVNGFLQITLPKH
ncbi:Small heat shock protein HSP20 protein [Dioscorea alata]|uniref:Small heat shock protein HSP20 protein n=1 Tax=Dioscorea alata TaxID=55571 RepID=A0ACB7W3D8_DIOAL|nr:Small heat shock protein HSP20 protein [Dioscorea alata]